MFALWIPAVAGVSVLFGLIGPCIGGTAFITPGPGTASKSLEVTYNFTGNTETPFCIFDWGDGDADIAELDDANSPTATTHTYNISAFWSVHIICVTYIDTFTFDDDAVYAGDTITGFDVSNFTSDIIVGIPSPVTDDVVLGILFATGSGVNFTVTVMADNFAVTVTDYTAPDPEFITIPSSHLQSSGMYALEVNATNPISTISRYIILAVEQPITGVALTSQYQTGTSYYFLINNAHEIATALTGENPVFTWWMSSVTTLVDTAVEACDGLKTSNAFAIQHNETGTFILQQEIANHVSMVSTELNVSFYYPVNGLSATISKDVVFYNEHFTFTINVASTADLQMGTVTCDIQFGDITTQALSFDLTTTPYASLTTANKQQVSSGKQIMAGWYYPTILCSNELHANIEGVPTTQSFDLSLISVNPVASIEVAHNSDNITYHAYTKQFQMTLSLGSGTLPLANLTCVFTYNDAKSPINATIDLSEGNPFTTTIGFTLGDKQYTIEWNCSNELSYQTGQLEIYVYYDCWTKGTYFDEAVHFLPTRRTAYTHEPYTITGDVQVKTPYVCDLPVVSYFRIHSYNNDTETETFIANITSPNSDFISSHTFPKNTMQAGFYKIYLITSFPNHVGSPALEDFVFVEFTLPALQIKIVDEDKADNNKRSIKHSKKIVLDSYPSTDPASGLTGLPLPTRSWTCVTGVFTDADVDTYFFSGTLPGSTDCSQLFIDNGNKTDLEYYSITGDQFVLGQWYIFKLTFANGDRSSMKSVVTKTTEFDSIVGYQDCRKGCKNATGDLFKLIGGDFNMDLVIPSAVTGLDISSVTYLWTFMSFNDATEEFTDRSSVIENRTSSGLQISGSDLKSLTDTGLAFFQLTCTLNATDHAVTNISKQFVYNLPPYNGTCHLAFENGDLVGTRDVTGALQKVCIECSNWKDEGSRRQRGDQDDGGTLDYETRQVFLKADNTTDTSVASVALAMNGNMRNCFVLTATNTTVNGLALIETRIRDSYSEPYELSESYVNVVPPISDSISGAAGEQQVADFSAQLDDLLGAALKTGNTQSATTVIVSGSTSLQIPGLESDTPDTIPGEELVGFLLQGELDADPTLIAIQEANFNLTKALSDIQITDTSSSIQLIGAVNTISAGPAANMDSASQDNLLNTFAAVSDSTGNLDLSDPVAIELITNLVAATASVGTLLVNDTLESTVTVSRELDTAEREMSGAYDDNKPSTDDEDFFYQQKKDKYLQLNFEEVQTRSNELDKQSTKLQYNILKNTGPAISIGVQMTYSSEGNSDATAVKKNKASEFRTNPIVVNDVELYLGFANTGDETEVTVALSQSSNVLKLDKSKRASDGKGQFKFITTTNSQLASFTTIIKLPPVVMTLIEPFISPEDASGFSYHKILLKSKDDMLCVAPVPTSTEIAYYKVWINKPSEDTVSKVNFIAAEGAYPENGYSVCFSATQRGPDIGNWRVGVEAIAGVGPSRRRRSATNTTSLYPTYNFGVVTTACMVWDDNSQSWTSSTCDGKWNITSNTLECRCPPQMEMTFTNSFYVAPNKIDFSSVFLKFSPLNQAAVMGVLAGIIVIYILVILWARRNDKIDLLKWGITPLLDNFAEDNYFYVIRVYTGMRPNSGTKSRIGMVIAGEEMDTGVRELYDGVRKEFTTGSVLNFLLSTNMFLGELEYLRLWHDNSGGGNFASWYLSKIEVQDVQRNETFTFLAERWLSVDDEDGSLECVLPLAKNDNINIFKNRFFVNAKSSLAESHIWISVVYRPQTSNFTRVQRASCALVFIMLTMISNAMYFQSGDEPNYSTPAEVQVGPFRFSLQQVYISLQCALMTTAGTLVVIYLFKLSRNKPPKESVLFKPKEESKSSKKYKIPYIDEWMEKEHEKSVKLEKHLVEKGYPKLEGFYLPYWCRYLAWLMVFVTFVVCGFFIMLYSMEWGKQKSEEWLTNFFLSFFESVFALDPVKVAVMALVFAIIFRAASESSIVVDRQTIMRKYAGSQRGMSGGIRLPAPPLDHKRLEEERVIRLREIKMKRIFRDVVIQVFQIWVLLSISFSNRDSQSYYMYQETQETLLDPIGQTAFSDIRSVSDYYNWLNNTAIINLFPENDYNGDKLHWRYRQFATGGAKFRVGPPRLRQLRVPQDTCDIPYMDTVNCYGKYKVHIEDTNNYCIGWNSTPCNPKDEVYKFSTDAWKFTSAIDIWGLPMTGVYTTYGGGGYIAKLSVNREVSHLIIQELYDQSWVDRQTRAVILEFTLYCLNANIYTYNMMMVEFPETGGAYTFSAILPLRVYQHTGALGKYTLACEIIFMLYLVVMTVMTIIGIYKERRAFFSQPWQVFDLVFIVAGYVAIAMYVARVVMTHYALEVFREDKKEFVNFYHVAIWDQILVLLIGILVFLAIFRLLNILGYNKRIGAVARVFTNAAGDLLWFGLFFLVIFTCYAALGVLLFGSQLTTYRNLYRTMGTLFISMIGKSKFTEIEETDPIMSKLYFMVFIFFVVYMILTMFLGILGHSISKVRKDNADEKGDEMVDYMMKKFKGFLGYGAGAGGGAGDRRARNISMYSAQPAAPWNMKKGRKFEYDNRQILEDIRMSLTEAMNMDPKEFSTPEPFMKHSKKPRH